MSRRNPKNDAAGRSNGDNIIELVRSALDTLRRSDRKVADVVLADPQAILTCTVAELARKAEVSQPTVLRFCVAIGCEGFTEFKLRLASSLALGTPATHSVIARTDAPSDVASKIFDFTISSLDWSRGRLDYEALDAIVEVLAQANRIEFFGFGASGIVARDAQQKFPLFDVPCGAETDPHQQIMLVSMMRPGDVVVLISNTASTRSLVEVARQARSRGCTVVGIAGRDGPVTECCDHVLILDTLDNTNIYTPTISRISALIIVDVLSTAVALRRDGDHAERFEQMKRHLSFLRSNIV